MIKQARDLVIFVLRRTFVDPVVAGRLTDTGWPPGLRAVVGVGLGLYAILMITAATSAVARGRLRLIINPPSGTLPALAVPLLCLAFIMALSCLFTAALHVTNWLRVPLVIIVVVAVIYPVEWSAVEPVDLITLGLAAALVIMVALRWRRRFHWLEFVLTLVIIGHAVVLHQAVRLAPLIPYAANLQLSQLSNLVLPLWALALPVAALAGAALVEITTSAVTWTVTGLWRQAGGRGGWWQRGLTLVLIGLVVVRVIQAGFRMALPTDPIGASQLLLASLICLAVFGGCSLVAMIADRTPAGDPQRRTDPDDLLPAFGRWAPALALILIVPISGPALLAYVLRGLQLSALRARVLSVDNAVVVDIWFAIVCVALYVSALLMAARGLRTAPLLITAFVVMLAASLAVELVHVVVTNDAVLIVYSLAAVLLLLWLAARRRLDAEAQIAIAGTLALMIAYEYRDWINEPLTQALALTGVSAALLVGLLWRILTDNEFARGDSTRLPQPSRVLLALASAIVGVTSAAQVALLGGRADIDLSQVEGIGDRLLGFALVQAVVFAGLVLAARGREVRGRGPTSPTSAAGTAARTA